MILHCKNAEMTIILSFLHFYSIKSYNFCYFFSPIQIWVSEVRKLNVVAQRGSGRPRKSWDEVVGSDGGAGCGLC